MECGVPVLSLPLFFTAAQREHALAQSGAQMLVRDRDGVLVREDRCRRTAPAARFPRAPRASATRRVRPARRRASACRPHNLLAVARGVVDAVGAAHAGRHLAVLPPGVLLEDVAGCHAALLSGATYIAAAAWQVWDLLRHSSPDFARMAAAIDGTRATSIILVPEYLAGLVAYLEHSGQRLPHLTLVAVGGARVAPATAASGRGRSDLPVRQGYGLTECGSVVMPARRHHARASAARARSLGAHALRIAEDGEILVEGPKYLGSDRRAAAAGRTHGHGARATSVASMPTGDCGSRVASPISSSLSFGRNISPEWIEGLLCEQRRHRAGNGARRGRRAACRR